MTSHSPERSFAVAPGMGVLLADVGVSAANVLRRAALPGDLFGRGNAWLTPGEYFRLWEALEVEEPAFPLRFAEVMSLEIFDVPIFAAACSPNLSVAARRLTQYKKLIGPMRLLVTETHTRTGIAYVWPDDMKPPVTLVMGELVFWVALARLATRTDVRPVAVTAPTLPPDEASYREYFGVPVVQSVEQAVDFSAKDAALPFVTANEGLWDFFEPQLRTRLTELEVGTSTAERVRSVLLELLPAGDPTMGAVARALAVSSRTLQRRLRAEETTYQALLDKTRESLARHYLTRSGLSTAEISFLLGYEEPNSFYRAFRNWTGTTPDAVRTATG